MPPDGITLYFRPVLFSLLYTMVAGEKQPFSLRIAILYCVQCYLYKNDYGRSSIVQTLLPQQETGLLSFAWYGQCTAKVSFSS